MDGINFHIRNRIREGFKVVVGLNCGWFLLESKEEEVGRPFLGGVTQVAEGFLKDDKSYSCDSTSMSVYCSSEVCFLAVGVSLLGVLRLLSLIKGLLAGVSCTVSLNALMDLSAFSCIAS